MNVSETITSESCAVATLPLGEKLDGPSGLTLLGVARTVHAAEHRVTVRQAAGRRARRSDAACPSRPATACSGCPAGSAAGRSRSSRRVAIGLMRAGGITLPGNGCPVSGSRIAAPPEKSPAPLRRAQHHARVGRAARVAEALVVAEHEQPVLRPAGRRRLPPNWFCSAPASSRRSSCFASSASSRLNSPAPRRATRSCRERVTTLTTEPALRPYSALNACVMMLEFLDRVGRRTQHEAGVEACRCSTRRRAGSCSTGCACR